MLKSHGDILTVPEEMRKLHAEYKNLGYRVEDPSFNIFFYLLDDGTKIRVYWENGAFYEEDV